MEKDTRIVHMSLVPTDNKEHVWVDIETPEGYELDKENSTLNRIVFKKKNTLPKTWEEFCETHPVKPEKEAYCGGDETFHWTINPSHRTKNTWPNEQYAKAALALCQLIQLRDCYNDGWIPDWTDVEEYKYIIFYSKDELCLDKFIANQRTLAFKTAELRDKFLENFRDLIEQAKPLL
jgi:hypothetical protein